MSRQSDRPYRPAPPPNSTPPSTWNGQPIHPPQQKPIAPPQTGPAPDSAQQAPNPSGANGAASASQATTKTKRTKRAKGQDKQQGSADTGASFEVPAPGKKLSSGRRRSWVVRTGLLVGALVAVGGTTLTTGVLIGSSRVPTTNKLTPAEAQQYGLSAFPAEPAAAFGQQYLKLCLTYPDQEQARAARSKVLAQLAASGVEDSCGWNKQGSASTPASITFTGRIDPIRRAQSTQGQAAYLSYAVTMTNGTLMRVTVPIWTSSTHTQPGGMRVIGDVGFMPATQIGNPPARKNERPTDETLARQLTGQVLTPYFQAWGASNRVQLDLLVTSDATARARSGMGGVLTQPQISDVTVYTTAQDSSDDGPRYRDGDSVQAHVRVSWQRSNGAQHETAYRVTLRLTANKWRVSDIHGAALSRTGS